MSTSSRRRRQLDFERRGNKRFHKEDSSSNDEESQTLCDENAQQTTYPRGSIKRIRLKNFMTFEKFSEEFDPKLNVILAPNGTGKSSLVCGICLGLGGKPYLLGRQGHLSEFIKRGEQQATIEIYISDGTSHCETKVKRKFYADRASSTWSINGYPANDREIDELMEEMNVQLDNLLQFMPQDRVSEFAALGPVQLLQETERVIDPSLYKMHIDLIEMGTQAGSVRDRVHNLQNDLDIANNKKIGLQSDIDRMREVEDLKRKVTCLEAKLHLASIETSTGTLRVSKTKLSSGEQKLNSTENALISLNKKYTTLRGKRGEVHEEVEAFKTQISNKAAILDQNSNRAEEYEKEIEDKLIRLKNLERESRKQEQMFRELEEKSHVYEENVLKLEQEQGKIMEVYSAEENTVMQITQKLRSVNLMLRDVEHRWLESDNQKQKIQESIHRLEQVNIQRTLELERRRPLFRGLTQAYEQLKTLSSEFIKPVIGPLITEITISDPCVAAYLEQQVPLATWTLFVVQCREDFAKIKSFNLLSEINVINFSGDPEARVTSITKEQDLSRFGVVGCLFDLFEASNIVKLVLNDECNLEQTFVGNQQAENNIQALFAKDHRIQRIYTAEKSFTIKRSRYSTASSIATASVNSSSLLGHNSAALDEKNALLQKLNIANKELITLSEKKLIRQNEFEKIKGEHQIADQKRREVKIEKQDIESKCVFSKRQLTETQKELHRLKNLPDPMTQEQDLKQRIANLQEALFENSRTLRSTQKEQLEVVEALSHSMLTFCYVDNQFFTATKKIEEENLQLREIKALIESLKDIVQQDCEELAYLKDELNRRFPQIYDWKDELETLPTDANELEDLLSEIKHEINMKTVNNPEALTMYEELTVQIETLATEIERGKDILEQQSGQIDEKKDMWLSRLNGAISRINSAFADHIESIGYIGQISLAGEDMHGQSFQNYALEIKVKFRANEPLKVLDSVRQSGGERAVATTLYLISLQTVTEIPFRVMDEINHGMDEENESKVMNLLAANITDEKMPQTFLFTPKIFKHFDFIEKGTTFILQNGPFVQPN